MRTPLLSLVVLCTIVFSACSTNEKRRSDPEPAVGRTQDNDARTDSARDFSHPIRNLSDTTSTP